MNHSKLNRETTAYHEAGHAVIGRVLCLTCGGATIVADQSENEQGHAIIADPWKSASDWDRVLSDHLDHQIAPPRCHSVSSAFRATIMARMAGAETENIIFGVCMVGGDADDQYHIAMMAQSRYSEFSEGKWEWYEPRMRRQVRRLIRRHRQKIELVAQALLECETLESGKIDALFSRKPAC